MNARFNMTWKVLLGTLGLSLIGCGGAAEGEGALTRSVGALEGAVTVTLNGAAEMTLECGVDTWVDPGATATDGDGAPLEVQTYNGGNDEYGPGPSSVAEGIYYVQYAAHDAEWNWDTKLRSVAVLDTRAPTLVLNGDAEVTHTCGSAYEDPRATVADECYDVSSQLIITGEVNGWIEGTYTLVYEVVDGAGNAPAAVTRTVHVVDCPTYE
ncbi:DUF5011 domain-containing protein [Hyalangium rubrum]|uniref:DUF5011 domain-containing protein n=1 Tax=Hyalangium rubrum TaxID=3103134 RepID=A0ABU5HHL2_9BACT|nr:DUF5011 domain-containing protein [Hyalangium sp. s54d21]MDY7232317.1 DUF5011 domain-containing protein [Hyalangium sp. s54d21]